MKVNGRSREIVPESWCQIALHTQDWGALFLIPGVDHRAEVVDHVRTVWRPSDIRKEGVSGYVTAGT